MEKPRLPAGLRQLFKGRNRNRDLVTDAVNVKHAAGKTRLRHDSGQPGYHLSASISSEMSAALTEWVRAPLET